MKQQRGKFRLTALLLSLLFVLLAGYGGYSVYTYGSRWFASTNNPRVRQMKNNVIAGSVYDRNGVLMASTVEGKRTYQQSLLARSSVVHVLGDGSGNVSNGVETFMSAYLLGYHATLTEKVTQWLNGETYQGDNIVLTIDAGLSAAAAQAFTTNSGTADKAGAVVVLNYKTGEVLLSQSYPNFDPDNITSSVSDDPQKPFWNRATQSVLAPGSTFKIITTVAALENMQDVQSRVFDCTGALQVMDKTITDAGNAHHGSLSLQKAFVVSCNNTFAQLALEMGDSVLRKTAENFGFNDNFLFQDIVVENSTYPTTGRNYVEVAWSGAGQSALTATPMHMALVAAAIANNGVIMEPRLLLSATSPAGASRYTFSSKIYRTATSPQVAAVVKSYMLECVKTGTGKNAAVSGLTICGKTGSAEASLNGEAVTNAWFVGFIDSDTMPYAVCVLVENGGGGGSVAAPIAKTVFEYLKEHYAQ